jgi:hypothetical protein
MSDRSGVVSNSLGDGMSGKGVACVIGATSADMLPRAGIPPPQAERATHVRMSEEP